MKKNLLQNWLQCLLVALAAILMVSCQSNAYYKERSVEKARKYLLENTKNLSQVKRQYIKYSSPVLLYNSIFSQFKSSTNQYQVCIAWEVPGEKDLFLVFGTGNYHMRDWDPIRIVRKQFIDKDQAKITAMKTAVTYVMNNMLFLSDETRNHIRFSTPKFAMTHFPLERLGLLDKVDAFGKAKSAKKLAEEKALLDKKEQVALIYNTGDNATRVVVLGVATMGLSGWQPVTGVEVTTEELKKHISSDLL